MAAFDGNPRRGARQARQRLRTRGAGASWLVPMQGGTKSHVSAKWLQVIMRRTTKCTARG